MSATTVFVGSAQVSGGGGDVRSPDPSPSEALDMPPVIENAGHVPAGRMQSFQFPRWRLAPRPSLVDFPPRH